MTHGRHYKVLYSTRQTIPQRLITTSIRKTPPKPRRVLPPTVLMLDDDPPENIPPFYKNPTYLVQEGDEIKIWWDGDDKFYAGIARNLRVDGKRRVEYDDGQVMYHDLSKEVFYLTGESIDRFLASRYPEALVGHVGDQPVSYPQLAPLVRIGDKVDVYWEEYRVYFSGTVTGMNHNGWCSVCYDDGDKGPILFSDVAFRFTDMSAIRAYSDIM